MTNQRNTHTTNMSASRHQSASDFRPPLTSDHSIVQLAAASLLHEVDSATELKRSQRLKEEIDRLKSSIPTTSLVPQVIDQQQASSTTTDTFQTRRSRSKADEHHRQPTQTQPQPQSQPEPQVLGAPLASLDFSISTETPGDSLLFHLGQIPGDNNNPRQQSSCSSSATFETPTLSGYLDCDELSDMVDDSLFEITNAGCLSQSVFPRAPVATSSGHSQPRTTTTTTTTSKTSQRQEQQEGERTPTNEQAIEEKVSENNHESKKPVIMLRVGQGGVAQSVASSSISSAPQSTIQLNNQPQNFHTQHQAHDYSSTSSVPRQIRSSSLSASQLKSSSQSNSNRQSSSSSGRRRSKTTPRPTSGGRPGGGAEELNEAAADDDSSTTTDNNDDSPHSTLPNSKRGPPRHSQATLAKTHQPAAQQARPATKKRSQSNSMLNASELEQNINRRCPICCEQQELECHQSSAPTGKKTGGKRRFTFSLFNLFTNGPQQPRAAEHDNAISIATCQHHLKHNSISRLAIKSVPGPVTSTSSKQTSPSSLHHHKRQTASNSTTTTSRTRTSDNQQEPRPPMRLRDSIKITNQRKQRQSINNNKTKASHQSSREQADEVLLDLSCPIVSRPSATLRNSAGGQQKPLSNSTTLIKNKSVKFITPDRVLILSPAPQIVDDELDSGGHLSRSSGRAPGHKLSSSSSHLSSLPGLQQTTPRLDSQLPAPIIKRSPNINQNQDRAYRQLVPKSSSYSQTEPDKSLEELLAKYEQNNKIVAEINEKLQLTETISSNKTALDTSTSLSLEEEEEEVSTSDLNNGKQQVNSQSEPQVDTEEQQTQTQTQLAPSSLEDDVDEELLEAIQRQFDAFNLMSPTAAAAAVIHCPEEQLEEDFSHCDCNNIDRQKQEQYLRRLNEANDQIKEVSHQRDVRRAAADSIGGASLTSLHHDVDENEDEGAKQLRLIISDKDGRRVRAGSSTTREAASDLHVKSKKKTTTRRLHDDGAASSSGSSSSLSLVAAARADEPLVTGSQAKTTTEDDGDEEEEASGFSRDWLSKQSKALG